MKDFLLRARVVVRASNIKISRRHLAHYVKKLHQKACRTCSTIIFPYSVNQIIDLWHCCCSRRRFLNSLRPSNTGNIFVQLVAQHCCKVLLPVLPPPQATCQTSGFVAKSRTELYFVQHVAATCNTEICCATSCLRGW